MSSRRGHWRVSSPTRPSGWLVYTEGPTDQWDPADEHYAVRVLASRSATVLAQQQIETVIPELLVPPVTNPIKPGPIHLQAGGRFCADATMPCVTPFPSPGNIGGSRFLKRLN